ncbi:MAG: response regulator, partial [Thauera sp.]|nr:response regulator [Thauera sp.]
VNCSLGLDDWLASQRRPPDMTVLDLNLPGEGGLEVARRLRATYPAMGIVMLTGRKETADRISGYASGADVYLTKPVSGEELLAVLERQAREHRHTLCTGRTHGVHAEPTTFGLKIAVWVDEMRRNRDRLHQARAAVAVGAISGAVGTHSTAPPELEEFVCRKLGLGLEAVS